MNHPHQMIFGSDRPVFLRSLQFPKDMVILVLAPHPDDFDEIGVTLRCFHDNGNPIYVDVLSSSASGVEDSFCTPPTEEQKAGVRENEQRDSCRFFGLPESNLSFLRLPEDADGHVVESQEAVDRVRERLVSKNPDLVFLPHGNDSNLGHQRVYSMFRKVESEVDYPITAFLARDPKTISMRNDLYTVFGREEADWKAELLRFHQSQHQRNLNTRGYGFDERILRVNRETARGLSKNNMFAEVFEIQSLGKPF